MTQAKILLLLALALACGCTAREPCIQYIECPDGDCAQQAGELCPKGYRQLGESDVGPDFGDFEKQHFPGASSGVPHMLATCNP